jgi:hypothetical protein
LLQYNVGKAGTKGWHRLEAYLPGPQANQFGSTALAYPLSFQSIQVFRQPDSLEANYGGTIYLDDFYAESGPNVQDYRFTRPNGKTLDVVWSDNSSGQVSIPTLSANATVTDRNGASSTLAASNGKLTFTISDPMLFIEHQAASLTAVTPPPPPTGTTSCVLSGNNVQHSTNFSANSFLSLWNRYDLYAPGNRSYVWGNQPFASGTESYADASGGSRQVLYFDKSRMEINHPENDPNAQGYVTNGLLTNELITGKLQVGDKQFKQCGAAQVPVAGDPDDTYGPKYASLAARLHDPATPVNGLILTKTIKADGSLGDNSALASYNVVGGYYVPDTKHTIAKPFWDFLNNGQQKVYENGILAVGTLFNPWYEAPGLPITEAYWAKVKVGGQVKDVLVQAFERRVLTYTPSNPPAYQVEWGNIGQHYYKWRYGN